MLCFGSKVWLADGLAPSVRSAELLTGGGPGGARQLCHGRQSPGFDAALLEV